MLIDVTLPQLGESVTEGTISKWLVKEGDVVTKDQPLVEIATDKADSELPAPTAGRIGKILAMEGAVVPVKALLCQIDDAATAAEPAAKSTTAPNMASATAPAKPPGSDGNGPARSAMGGALATPTARKAALEHDVDLGDVRGSGTHGRVTKDDVIRASGAGGAGGTDASVGSVRADSPLLTAPQRTEPPPPARVPGEPTPRAATPPQQIAQMLNQAGQAGQTGGFVPPIPGVGFAHFKLPQYRPTDGDKVVPFTRRRRITSDHMTYSKFASPHVVTVAEIDLHKASRLREANKDAYKKEGHALTMLAFVVVAAARALRENPGLNARVLDDAYVLFKDINMGVAVDSPDGLVVPVIRRADELGVRGIVRSIDDVAKRAKNGKITIDDLSGATFSITNPGIKGNLFGGAIINQPNVGILRMGEIQKRVVVVEGEGGEDHMVIHPVMYMALSYDHRIVDGVAANSFLWRVTEILEKADFEV